MKSEVIARLFGNAAGLCSMCRTRLLLDDIKIGEMAHIIAKREGGPRGKTTFEGDVNGYDNLILLCPSHHSEADGAPLRFPVPRLRSIKAAHENWVKLSLSDHSNRHLDVNGLNDLMKFMPFLRIRSALEFLPETLHGDPFLLSLTAIEAFQFDHPECCPFTDVMLQQKFSAFVTALESLWAEVQQTPSGYEIYQDGPDRSSLSIKILNRELEYQEKARAKQNIRAAAAYLVPAFEDFLGYLRSAYPDVNLSAFR